MKFEEKLQTIDDLQRKIESFGKFPEEIKRKIDYRFRLDWNYYSNAIEGGTLTKQETKDVMMGHIEVQKGKPFKDFREMQGHDEVVISIMNLGKGIKRLSEARIKSIHKAIMFEPDAEVKKKIGKWKTEPNEIINYKGEKFEFAAPNEVAELMHDLLNTTNAAIDATRVNKKNPPHPVHIAFQFHNKYVRIHPFYDGNGRTARIFTNLILISYGYPPIIIKDTEKDRYNQILADIQGYGAAEGLFYNFLADRLIDSLNLIIDTLEGKNMDEPDTLLKEILILQKKQNPPVEEIKKSKTETIRILEQTYFKLIDETHKKVVHFSPLFKTSGWAYLEEPGEDGKIPMVPIWGDIDRIKANHAFIAKRTGDSTQSFKTLFYLKDYKDQNKFSMELSLKLHLYEKAWEIEIFVGGLMGGSVIGGTLMDLIKIMSKNVDPEKIYGKSSKYFLGELKYGEQLSDMILQLEAEKISKLILYFIKSKTNNV